jgi:hypothetical protein
MWRVLIVAALAAAACTPGDAAVHDHGAVASGDAASVDAAGADDVSTDAAGAGAAPGVAPDPGSAPASAAGLAAEPSTDPAAEPGALGTVRTAAVEGRTGPDGQPFHVAIRAPGDVPHARSYGRRTLSIALRDGAPGMRQYPCTSCHAGRRVELRDQRTGGAHDDIDTRHPFETGATCGTCHAADDVEMLALRSGERAPLAHAYRACAQCHYAQADAWAAGVHGKRLDAWQGRRVVMGCTDCHDPHAPRLDLRVPFRAPTIHQRRGRQP